MDRQDTGRLSTTRRDASALSWALSHWNHVFVVVACSIYHLLTTSLPALYTALGKLGYKSYHYIENGNNKKDNHIYCWLEAMIAKVYGEGEVYGRSEFDRILGRYSVRITPNKCFTHLGLEADKHLEQGRN